MPDINQYIKNINEKLQLLLRQHALVQKENQKLKGELEQIRKKASETNSQLELLELRLEVMKAQKGVMTDEEKRSFEKRINQYLKEVEKCIALLSE
jgi:poly-D-alanine transfer protein DltD